MTQHFYPTRDGITREIVILPQDYKNRFIDYCTGEGMSKGEAILLFDDMVDMITKYIPNDATPEDMAAYWINEDRRNY